MVGNNVIDENGRRDSPADHELKEIDRLVSVSLLATFLREYPLTYLTKDERRVYAAFMAYVVGLEGRLFEEAGIGR